MQRTHVTNVRARIEGEAWMNIANPDLSMEQAVEKLEALGNEILEVDPENRRIKVMQEDLGTSLVWKCNHCNAISKYKKVIVEHEKQCRRMSSQQ